MALNFNDFVQQYFGGGGFGFNGSVGQNYGQFNQPSGQYNFQPTYGGQYNAGGHSPLGSGPSMGGQYNGMPSGGLPQFPMYGAPQGGQSSQYGGVSSQFNQPPRPGMQGDPTKIANWNTPQGGSSPFLYGMHAGSPSMQQRLGALANMAGQAQWRMGSPAPSVIHGAPVRAF